MGYRTPKPTILIDGITLHHEREAAEKLGLSVHQLKKHRKEHTGAAYYQVGQSYYYSEKDLLEFLDNQRVSTLEQY